MPVPDLVLTEAGAQRADRLKLLGSADLVLMVNPPTEEEIRAIRSEQRSLVSSVQKAMIVRK